MAAYQRSLVAVYDPRFPGPSGEQLAAQRLRTLSNLGYALRQVPDRAAEAMAAYNRVVAIAPQEAYTAHLNRGVASYARHEMDAAVKAFGSAVAALPVHAEGYNKLAAALEKLARYSEASSQLSHSLRMWPARANPAHLHLGDMELSAGNVSAAQAIFETALRLEPTSLPAHDRLAQLMRAHGRWHEAQLLHHRATRLAPTLPEAWYEAGRSLGGIRSRTAEALACYGKAHELLPSHYAYALQPAAEAAEAALVGAGPGAPQEGETAVGEVAGMGFVSEWFRFLNLRWLQSTTTLRQMRHALQQQRILVVRRAFNVQVAEDALSALERSAAHPSRWRRVRERQRDDSASYYRRHTLRPQHLALEPALQEVARFLTTELFGRLLLQLAGLNHREHLRRLREQPQLTGVRACWYRAGDTDRISRISRMNASRMNMNAAVPSGMDMYAMGEASTAIYFRWALTRGWSAELGGMLTSCCPLRRVLPTSNSLAVRLLGASHELLLTTPVSGRVRAPRRLFFFEGWLRLPDALQPAEPLLHRIGQLPRLTVVNSHAHAVEAAQASERAALALGLPPPPRSPPAPPRYSPLPPDAARVNTTARVLALPPDAVSELEQWLNGSWLHHEQCLGRIGEALRKHHPVTIHNAFRAPVARAVLRALDGLAPAAWRRDDHWQGSAYADSGFYTRRWYLDRLDAAAPAGSAGGSAGSSAGGSAGGSASADQGTGQGARLLRRLHHFLDGLATRALLTRLGGIKLSGNSSVGATLFRHGDHLGPHSGMDVGDGTNAGTNAGKRIDTHARRRLGFTWQLSPQRAAERGGEHVY